MGRGGSCASAPSPSTSLPASTTAPRCGCAGTVVKLRGHGVPRLDGRGRGDLLVHVTVDIPSHIKGEERELFERLADLRGEAVAGEQKGIFRRLRDSFLGE